MTIRIEVTQINPFNVSYITIEGGRVSYFSGSLTPLCLSNLFGKKAAVARFALEDAANPETALKAAIAHCPRYDGGPNAGKPTYEMRLVPRWQP